MEQNKSHEVLIPASRYNELLFAEKSLDELLKNPEGFIIISHTITMGHMCYTDYTNNTYYKAVKRDDLVEQLTVQVHALTEEVGELKKESDKPKPWWKILF